MDVDRSGLVTNFDALAVINAISRSRDSVLPLVRPTEARFYDVNGDQRLSPIDALWVINGINRYQSPLHLLANLPPEADPNLNNVATAKMVDFIGTSLPLVQVAVVNDATVFE